MITVSRAWTVAGAAVALGCALAGGAPAGAAERAAIPFAGRVSTSTMGELVAAAAIPPPPQPLAAVEGASGSGAGGSLSPVAAGLLSAVVPGSGQLALGARRGWIYLGVEVVAWFGAWALGEAGDQAESDFAVFADRHWAWGRYESVGTCGEGLGPTADFAEERARLEDLYANDRDDFYDDIGDLSIYACGWDTQGNRAAFNGMRDDANALYGGARAFTTAAFLNHIVSAVDAAKAAANRRKTREHAFDLRVTPGRGIVPDVRFAMNRSF